MAASVLWLLLAATAATISTTGGLKLGKSEVWSSSFSQVNDQPPVISQQHLTEDQGFLGESPVSPGSPVGSGLAGLQHAVAH